MKKWEFILAIKSQRYLSTLCPTTKLHLSGIFLKTVLNKSHSLILAVFIIATIAVIWSDLWQRQSFKISNVPAFALGTTGRVVRV